MYIDEYSNPFSVKNIIKDTKEDYKRHQMKTAMNEQDEKQKYEYKKMRNEMKGKRKKAIINIITLPIIFLQCLIL